MKPRYKVDLPRQQADHEANYQRLLRLMPDLNHCEQWQYIVSNDDYIAISIQERTKYTTTVYLLQYFKSFNICNNNPVYSNNPVKVQLNKIRLKVRLYHDASLAEVLSWQHHIRFQARYNYPNRHMHQCDEKARLNSFLSELLTHCLRHGRVAENIADNIVSATING